MLAAVIAEGVAIVLLGILVLGLLRSHALILKALHELGAGLELEKEAGTGVSLATTGGKPGPVPVELESGVVQATRKDSTTAHDIVGTDLDRAERQVTVTTPDTRTPVRNGAAAVSDARGYVIFPESKSCSDGGAGGSSRWGLEPTT